MSSQTQIDLIVHVVNTCTVHGYKELYQGEAVIIANHALNHTEKAADHKCAT